MVRLSIVVPCYNEEKNIPLILDRFDNVIKRSDIELILVDNGSYDNTEAVLKKLLPQYLFARSVKVKKNIGYGYGVMTGLRSAKGDFLAWTHADMQTDPKDVIVGFELLEKKQDPENFFIKGRRIGRPFSDLFFTKGMSIFSSIMLRKRLNDINAQPNMFHCSLLNNISNPPLDFSLDLYMFYMAKKNNMNIQRFPVNFSRRIHGHSHWDFGIFSKFKLIQRTMKFTLELQKRIKKEYVENNS